MIGVARNGPVAAPAEVAERRRPVADEQAEREALAVLVSVHGLGPVTLTRLLTTFGSAVATLEVGRHGGGAARLLAASRDAHGEARAVTSAVADGIVAAARDADRIVGRVRSAGLTIISLDDGAYPARLRAIEMPPPVIFVRGSVAALSRQRAVAVVGTRRPTEAGRRIAARIAVALVRTGAVVVSGLAVGIDGAAHAGVVDEDGETVAVLGSGHERLFPRAHRRLVEDIVARGGAVVSELAPDVDATPGTFPRRNRVIAGLAEATVVVEAGHRSGALITAAWALEQGRGCFLVPGSLDAPASAGCLAFLRECPGIARVVAGIPELLIDLELVPEDGASSPILPSAEAVLVEVGPAARRIGRELVEGVSTADALVAATDLPIATVLAALTILEDRGLVVSAYGRYRPSGRLAGAEPARRAPR